MDDILDNIELSASFNQEELVTELFKENLRLRIRFEVIQDILENFVMKAKGISRKESKEIFSQLYSGHLEDQFVNNKFLSEAWRLKMKEELGI